MSIDPLNCPLCGDANFCANVSKSDNNALCWCNSPAIVFPEELIHQVPSALRQKACICKNCADKFKNRLTGLA